MPIPQDRIIYPITNYQLPITNYQLPISHYQTITNLDKQKFHLRLFQRAFLYQKADKL